MPTTSLSEKSRDWKNRMTLELSHFTAAVLFSVFASVVFGITQRNTAREQIRYGLYCFFLFVGGVFLAGWVMWVLRH
jgi:heme A synthase